LLKIKKKYIVSKHRNNKQIINKLQLSIKIINNLFTSSTFVGGAFLLWPHNNNQGRKTKVKIIKVMKDHKCSSIHQLNWDLLFECLGRIGFWEGGGIVSPANLLFMCGVCIVNVCLLRACTKEDVVRGASSSIYYILYNSDWSHCYRVVFCISCWTISKKWLFNIFVFSWSLQCLNCFSFFKYYTWEVFMMSIFI